VAGQGGRPGVMSRGRGRGKGEAAGPCMGRGMQARKG